MSWIYEKSSAWRSLVKKTRVSPSAMWAFTIGCLSVSALAGFYTIRIASPGERRQQPIKQHAGGDAEKVADANKQRLQQLLNEVKQGQGVSEERYRMALEGRTKGTRVGTTMRGSQNAPQSSGGEATSPGTPASPR